MEKIKRTLSKSFIYLFLLVLCIVTLYPVYWMLYAGTFSPSELLHFVFTLIPGDQIVSNFEQISLAFNVVTVLKNTIFVSIVGTAVATFVNVLMGYALAKYDFKYKKTIFNCFMVSMFVGGAAVMIPQFQIVYKMGLYNSLWAIILPGLYSTYVVFLVKQTLMDFPTEIIQSGRIDGCSEFGIFIKLVVPNVKAIISTVVIITFMGYWNGYLWNLIVTSSIDKYTLQVALASIYPTSGLWTYAHIKMLGAAISTLPLIILFLAMQKYFINSLTGAVKG